MFGAHASPYQTAGDWQINVSSRNLVSNDHYNGTVEQVERHERENYITNRQNLIDVGVTKVLTRRVSATVAVPFVYSSWAFRNPASPLPGPRIEEPQWGRGLGDISATARSWIFTPAAHPNWNVSAGGGIKFPTGNAAYRDTFLVVRGALPGILGNPVPNFVEKEEKQYVDQSVQPGDGGWGVIMETQAFWRVKRTFVFGSVSYLANPKDTNGTPSIATILGVPPAPGTPNANARLGENSVPDQYLLRVGGTVPVWKGFNATLAWRMEGARRYDLFGESHGFRRPGTAMFVEPGISYTQGQHAISFNVPLGYYYNRHPNPLTNNPGDATFPRQIFLTSYSLRFGRRPAVPPPPVAPAAPRRESTTSGTTSPSSPASAATPICPPS